VSISSTTSAKFTIKKGCFFGNNHYNNSGSVEVIDYISDAESINRGSRVMVDLCFTLVK